MLQKVGNLFTKVTDWSATRGHIIFALYFAVYGSILEWYHKLDLNFIMLIGAIQAFLLGHQIKDGYFGKDDK